jgi:hypothetical protein
MEEEPAFEEPTLVELGDLWELTRQATGKVQAPHDSSTFDTNATH